MIATPTWMFRRTSMRHRSIYFEATSLGIDPDSYPPMIEFRKKLARAQRIARIMRDPFFLPAEQASAA